MVAINRKADALKKFNNGAIDNIRLFCEDIGTNGAKRFHVTDPKNIYTKMTSDDSEQSHYYELWTDSLNMVFALDLDIHGKTYDESKQIMLDNIKKIRMAAKTYYDYDYKVKDIIVLESEPTISFKESKKYSYHIIFRGLVFQTCEVCRDFFDKANSDYKLEHCDNSIYNVTCLRLCYNSKMGKNAILIPITVTINDEQTLTDVTTLLSPYQFFLKTMITYIFPYETKIIKKNKMFKKPKPEPTEQLDKPLNTIENINLEQILFLLPHNYCDDYDSWIKIGLALHSCENVSKNEMFELWDKWSQQSDKYRSKDIMKRWNSFGRARPISIGYIINLCKQCGITNIYKNSKQSFEQIIEDFPVREIMLDTNNQTTIVEQSKLEPEIFIPYLNKKLIAVQSEKGTGKTTNFLKAMFDGNRISDDTTILFISSRRTFGAKLLGDLEQFGFVLYSNIKGTDIDNGKVICQVDSLTRLTVDRFDYVIVDECESTARYITSRHFTKNSKASVIVSTLEQRISEANQVVIMDADLSNRCTEYYKTIMNINDEDVKLIVNTFKAFSEYTITAMSYDDWVQKILEDIGEDKKLAIPMASNSKAKDLKTKIEQDYPECRTLLIHKETKDEDKIAGLMKVNDTWQAYDVIIYTPSVCMGVSFDVPNYFNNIYAYGCEQSLGSQEFCQMLHRIREPKDKTIFLSLNAYRQYEETEDILTFEQTEEILCSDYYLTHYDLHQNIISVKMGRGGIDGNERTLIYPYKEDPNYRLFVYNALENILNTLNFGASLFGYIKAKCYKIEFFKYGFESRNTSVKISMKNIRDSRESTEIEASIQGILEAPEIDKEEFIDLVKRRDEMLETDDIQKINKFRFRECYDIHDELTYELVEEFNVKEKMKQYHNLASIINIEEQTTNNKLSIMKENVTKDKWLNTCYMDFTSKCTYTHHLYATNIVSSCGFDINDRDRLINQVDLTTNIDTCMSYMETHKKNIAFKFGLKIYNKDLQALDFRERIKIINNVIINFYGLRVKRVSPYKNTLTAENIFYKLSDNMMWDGLPREEKIIPVKLKINEGDMFNPMSFEQLKFYMEDAEVNE